MFSLLNDNEMFMDIEGYEGQYSISNYSRVWSHKQRGKFMKPAPDGGGYLSVSLCNDGNHRAFRLHVLVGNAFVGKRENGLTFDHIDRNRLNNCASNIRLATRSEQNINKKIRYDNKLREKNITITNDIYYQIRIKRNGKIVRCKYLRLDKFSLADAVKVRDKFLADLN